ncbi:MAG TPA: hypothetical protein VF159_07265, partial [Gemmatimonadaceae bacterium]
EILLEAEPPKAVEALRGRVWRRTVTRAELPAIERELPVISTKLLAGRTVIRVLGDSLPGDHFEPAEATLEDVYFAALHRPTVPPRAE